MSEQPAAEPPTLGAPREVRIASVLLVGMGAVLLASGVTGLFYRQDAVAQLESSAESTLLTRHQLDVIALVAVIGILLLGLLLVVAGGYVRQGRSWARVLAFVTAGLIALIMGVGAIGGAGVFAVVLLAAAVGAISCLMQSSAGPFFAARR